jgi:hypothetical protein
MRGLIIPFFDEEPAMYKCTTTFDDEFFFDADFRDAASPIYLGWCKDDMECTPFQVADARHCPERAAALLISWFGLDYWLHPDDEIGEDEYGNTTYGGKTEQEYIEALILDVERLDEGDEDD